MTGAAWLFGIAHAACLGLAFALSASQGLAETDINGVIIDGTAPVEAPAAKDGPDEQWIETDSPSSVLRIISMKARPGEDCKDVLYQLQEPISERYELSPGTELVLDRSRLCMIALRNDSDGRAVSVRFDERFEEIAIGGDSRLTSGLRLGPGHRIETPLRRPDQDRFSFLVELIWYDARTAEAPVVESVTISLVAPGAPSEDTSDIFKEP